MCLEPIRYSFPVLLTLPKYATRIGDGSTLEEVIARCDEHAPFLISQCTSDLSELDWPTTPFYQWIIKRHDVSERPSVSMASKINLGLRRLTEKNWSVCVKGLNPSDPLPWRSTVCRYLRHFLRELATARQLHQLRVATLPLRSPNPMEVRHHDARHGHAP